MKKLLLGLVFATFSFAAFAQQRGYKGMVHAAWLTMQDDFSCEVTTVHGYQFNPYLFVGGGAGVDIFKDAIRKGTNDQRSEFSIPVFADVRGYLLKGGISPYVDAKVGYAFSCEEDGTGIYVAPEIGCRIGFTSHFAINVGAQWVINHGISDRADISNDGGVCVKIGVEF